MEQPVVKVILIQEDDPPAQLQPEDVEPMLALVPYQPTLFAPHNFMVGMIKIIVGPPFPPNMG